MEILATIETVKVKKGIIDATIEICKTLTKNVKHDSCDSRVGIFIADVYADIAFITVNGNKEYFCHVANGTNEAVELFNNGGFKKYLPRL